MARGQEITKLDMFEAGLSGGLESAKQRDALAEKLGVGICFDVGHANVSGFKISEQMEILKGRIDVLHIHDNLGKGQKDAHMLPFDGSVDWEDVALGMAKSEFSGLLDVEVTAWALSGDERTRSELGGKILNRAARLIEMSKGK